MRSVLFLVLLQVMSFGQAVAQDQTPLADEASAPGGEQPSGDTGGYWDANQPSTPANASGDNSDYWDALSNNGLSGPTEPFGTESPVSGPEVPPASLFAGPEPRGLYELPQSITDDVLDRPLPTSAAVPTNPTPGDDQTPAAQPVSDEELNSDLLLRQVGTEEYKKIERIYGDSVARHMIWEQNKPGNQNNPQAFADKIGTINSILNADPTDPEALVKDSAKQAGIESATESLSESGKGTVGVLAGVAGGLDAVQSVSSATKSPMAAATLPLVLAENSFASQAERAAVLKPMYDDMNASRDAGVKNMIEITRNDPVQGKVAMEKLANQFGGDVGYIKAQYWKTIATQRQQGKRP